MIKNSTKKALLEVGDFTRQTAIVYGLSKVYYTIHTNKINNSLGVFAWNY